MINSYDFPLTSRHNARKKGWKLSRLPEKTQCRGLRRSTWEPWRLQRWFWLREGDLGFSEAPFFGETYHSGKIRNDQRNDSQRIFQKHDTILWSLKSWQHQNRTCPPQNTARPATVDLIVFQGPGGNFGLIVDTGIMLNHKLTWINVSMW